jgi:AAA15 family ATPase/GTPase
MLSKIVIENFRSIKNRIEFSFEATSFKEHVANVAQMKNSQILKSSVIYGANASGKSNVLKAFKAVDYLILRSASFTPKKAIDPYEPFLLDQHSRKKPVKLELDFYIENILYTFKIEFLEYEVIREELIFKPKRQSSTIYSRVKNTPIYFGEYYRGERKSIEKKLLPNQLFLSKAVLDNVEILTPVYNFFEEKVASYPFFEDFHENRLQQLYARRLADVDDTEFSEKFNRLICALDTGIIRVKSESIDWKNNILPDDLPESVKERIKEDYKYRIKTIHNVYENDNLSGEISFDKDEESKGTQRLFVLAGIILDAFEDGTILIIDEFEKNLHPHITKSLIKLFHNPEVNKKNAQLIFATHDLSQLDSNIFRRDQIWFAEKNERGETDLFSLAEIKGIRNNIPFDKWYDSGKFGATPIINELEMSL